MTRIAPVLAAGCVLLSSVLDAQASPANSPRWEAGPSLIVGIDHLAGAAVAFRVAELSRLRLAVEASAHTPIFPMSYYGCSFDCSATWPPTEARLLGTVGLRGTVPLSGRWYGIGDATLAHARWRGPVSGTTFSAVGGLGIGRESRQATRSLELRWQRFGTTGVSVDAWRLGWLFRW